MGFLMDGLESESYDRQYEDGELLRRILSYFAPYRNQMILVAVMITLTSIMGALGPIVIAKGVDLMDQNPTTTTMAIAALGISLIGASAWVFNFIRQIFSARVTSNVVLQLRTDVFAATVRHDMSFYDEIPSGKIVSRVTSDTQDFAEVVNLTLNLISQVMLILVLLIYLLTISVSLTVLLVAMAPIAALFALSFRRLARRVTQNSRRITATINAQIQESISGIMIAKGFRQEPAIYETFDTNNKQGYRVGLQRGLTFSAIFPVLGAATGISTAILFYVGGLTTQGAGGISSGDWYLFMQSVAYFWFPMTSIASFWSQFQDGLSAAERVFALIDREPKVQQTGNKPVGPRAEDHPDYTGDAPLTRGEIEFRHLHFSYNDREVVLPNFSLHIQPGETVALVGHTGAGKSSVGKLLTRFYEFQGGELLVDGRDVRTLNLGQYRQQIGGVPQEPFLFSGTVAENIKYGRPEATREEVERAAQQISHGDWVGALPAGLDTDVGERGASLSMGQRQLVALARVVLKDPAIFVLDEATASVDPFTEAQIQEGLEDLMRERTAIVIAHRLFTVRKADRIIVMKDGRIIEEGNHDDLIAAGGHYAELYNTYFRHQSLDYIDSWRETAAAGD